MLLLYCNFYYYFLSDNLEQSVGFEPTNTGFADQPL